MFDNLKEALRLQSNGYKVYPVHGISDRKCLCCSRWDDKEQRLIWPTGPPKCKAGKHPVYTRWRESATTDPEQAKRWWRGKGMNVGVLIEGHHTLDAESEGMERLRGWEATHGTLPITPTVETGSGARHYYFQPHPEIVALDPPEKVQFAVNAEGVEVELLTGGGLIAPPSNHHTGGRYKWIHGPETPRAEMPAWLVEKVVAHLKAEKAKKQPTATDHSDDYFAAAVVGGPKTFDSLGQLPSGGRNAKVCEVVGSLLRAGVPADDIMEAGEAWALGQSPPYDLSDLRDQIKSLAKSDARKRVAEVSFEELGDDLPVDSTATDSPVSINIITDNAVSTATTTADDLRLPAAAYHGIIGEMVRAVEEQTEAAPAAILLGMLTCFGSVVGRGSWVPFQQDRHYPWLFAGVVGPTSAGKGVAWGLARSPFVQAAPDWKACICHGVGSGEGLIERVRDDEDEGRDKRCLLRLDELASCLKSQKRDGSTLGETLLTAWGGGKLEVTNRRKTGNALEADHYSLSVVGDIQPTTLAKMTTGKLEASNGWMNRFSWVSVATGPDRDTAGDAGVFEKFLPRLAEALEFGRSAGEVPHPSNSEAATLWGKVSPSLRRSGDTVPHTDRARPQACRLALIYALADKSSVIKTEHLQAALAVWEYCRESARRLFGGPSGEPSPSNKTEPWDGGPTEDPPAFNLLRAVKAAGPAGINRTDGYAVFSRNRGADDLNHFFAELVDLGAVEEVNGRWYATGNGPPSGGPSYSSSSSANCDNGMTTTTDHSTPLVERTATDSPLIDSPLTRATGPQTTGDGPQATGPQATGPQATGPQATGTQTTADSPPTTAERGLL